MSGKRSNGVYYIRRWFPGWRDGWFELSTRVRSKTRAEALEAPVLQAYQEGRFDILDALKDGLLSLPELKRFSVKKGVDGASKRLEQKVAQIKAAANELDSLIEEFEANPPKRKDGNPLGDKTLAGYVGHARTFSAWFKKEHDRPATAFDLGDSKVLAAYREYLIDSRRKNPKDKAEYGRLQATANRHVNSLGKLCTWLIARGILSTNPAAKVRMSTAAENPSREDNYRYLERSQVPLLLNAADEEDKARPTPKGRARPCALWLETLVATGSTTYTEGSEITLSRVKFGRVVNGMVEVYIHGSKSQYRKRHVWIPESLALRLKAYARRHGIKYKEPLFPWGRSEGYAYWVRVRKRLVGQGHIEFEDTVTYDLRHTFAVHAIRGDPDHGIPGVDILTLQYLLGHKRLETTRMYARHRADDAPRALAVSAACMGLLAQQPSRE